MSSRWKTVAARFGPLPGAEAWFVFLANAYSIFRGSPGLFRIMCFTFTPIERRTSGSPHRTACFGYRSRIDSLGRPVASGIAEQASGSDDRLRRASMFTWVENLRLVTTDGVAQRKPIDRVYAQIASGSAAQTFISDFYRSAPPATRAQTETVAVDVTSVLPTSERTFEVEWIETTRDLYGTVKATDHWKGSFSIVINPPTDERLARVNPVGLYITNASWSKVLQEK